MWINSLTELILRKAEQIKKFRNILICTYFYVFVSTILDNFATNVYDFSNKRYLSIYPPKKA